MKNIAVKLGKWFIASAAHGLTLIEDELYYWEHGKRRATVQEMLAEILQRPTSVAAYDAKLNFLDGKKKVN